jgi:ACS family tartrate transporter-like MFS transporter
MGSVAGALLHLGGWCGLSGWQWLFLIEGLPAVGLSILFLLCLPDGPNEAAWLDGGEREWLRAALDKDHAGIAAVHSGGEVAHALQQKRVWVLGLFLMCLYIGNYGYIFSAPAMIQHVTGYGSTAVGFIVAVLGVLGALAMLLNSAHSDRRRERYLHLAAPCALVAAGFAGAGLSERTVIVVPAFACVMMGLSAIAAPVWSIPSEFLAGRSAAAGIAAVNTIAILGGFLGPYWMGLAADITGDYRRGLVTLVVPSLIAMLIMLGIRRDALRRKVAGIAAD